VAPIRDRNDEIIGNVVVFQDTTEKLKAEEEIAKARNLESIGRLAGGIAHDFNNILTSLFTNISIAKMMARPGEKIFDILTETEKVSTRAKSLTQQLLTFSVGGSPIRNTTSLVELIRDTVTFVLSGSNVKCEFDLPDDLCAAEIDEGQISQVFSNLTLNALQAMPEGGTIQISGKNTRLEGDRNIPLKEGNYIKLSVKDNGTGIPAEHLKKIFDLYFTTKKDGKGMGLPTSYSIIKAHDGYIQVESQTGRGTTFHIYLPTAPSAAVKKESKTEQGTDVSGRIMLMDDDESIRESVGELLKFFGYEVETACDGAEALELYRKFKEMERPFDVVIMDLTIPGGMGGKEAIQKLIEIDPDARAIVSSGYSNDPVMAEFRKYGFRGVVAKPYNFEELNDTLKKIIDKSNT